jgi:hypothetical protein
MKKEDEDNGTNVNEDAIIHHTAIEKAVDKILQNYGDGASPQHTEIGELKSSIDLVFPPNAQLVFMKGIKDKGFTFVDDILDDDEVLAKGRLPRGTPEGRGVIALVAMMGRLLGQRAFLNFCMDNAVAGGGHRQTCRFFSDL